MRDHDSAFESQSEDEPAHIAATRTVFDRTSDLYVELVGTAIDPRFETAADQATLDAFADTVQRQGGGAVLDVGCGTGRATAYLAERGLDISGTDISTAMLDRARQAHPSLKFETGSLTHLPVGDASLAGVVYWYSIIYTPLELLGSVWDELLRVLGPDGTVLVGFQAGDNERIERIDVHESGADLVVYRHCLEDVVESLTKSGLTVTATVRREPELENETSAQAFLLAQLNRAGRQR